MNKDIKARFDSLETALNNLIISITSYTPSVAAAEALVEADDDLSESLEQLVTHQRNYQTIERLRARSAVLDTHIMSALTQLAETRNELKNATPTTLPSKDNTYHRVHADQLLMFAQHIARYTVPPTYREPLPPHIKTEAAVVSNGIGPIIHKAEQQASIEDLPAGASENKGKAIGDLAPDIRAWLEPPENYATFTPWPTDDVVRRGALSRIEESFGRGVDPSSVDLAAATEVEG